MAQPTTAAAPPVVATASTAKPTFQPPLTNTPIDDAPLSTTLPLPSPTPKPSSPSSNDTTPNWTNIDSNPTDAPFPEVNPVE